MIRFLDSDKLQQGYYSSIGTVLQRRDSSKESQSLRVFLRDLGPRWVSAPAALGKNRFGGGTEPLVWGEFSLYQSPTYLYLREVEVKEDFLDLRRSANLLSSALRLYKMVSNALLTANESNRTLVLLWSGLVLLRELCPKEAVELRFTWNLLHEIGTAPSLWNCVKCGARLTAGASWSPDGLLCGVCARQTQYGYANSAELNNIRASALLSHRDFIRWSHSLAQSETEALDEHLKKLVTFFSDIR